jgi:hypothetical protein
MFLPFNDESMAVAQHSINVNEFVGKFSEAAIRLREDLQSGMISNGLLFERIKTDLA